MVVVVVVVVGGVEEEEDVEDVAEVAALFFACALTSALSFCLLTVDFSSPFNSFFWPWY